MSFIKVTEANYFKFDHDKYEIGDPVLIKRSHISSVDIFQRNNLNISDSTKKALVALFELEISELCVLKITLINGKDYIIFAPYENFNNFDKK